MNTINKFPPFDLERLLRTCFRPKVGERVAILIDLVNPQEIESFSFLNNPQYSIQQLGVQHFYENLRGGLLEKLQLKGGDIFAYQMTYGSNLDLPDVCYAPDGRSLSLSKDIYPEYNLILCISTYSATAPLTAFAKKYGFRGATLHGLNEIILSSGLAVDYHTVSRDAEKLRSGLTRADAVEIDFEVHNRKTTIRIELGKQEAQKSHGIASDGPDIVNLPAGEVYFVPESASGQFPYRYEDGSVALFNVEGRCIIGGELLFGSDLHFQVHLEKIKEDPAVGELGELGFGTQVLPVSGRDIQDEKILGTFHIATGRSDHLGGDITPDKFKFAKNASHDDILYSPEKTPEIKAPSVRLYKGGAVEVVIENYQPTKFLLGLLNS